LFAVYTTKLQALMFSKQVLGTLLHLKERSIDADPIELDM
jgi:hypothetical protein